MSMYSCMENEPMTLSVAQPQRLTLTEKVDSISRDTHEITLMVNELSRRIYGNSTPKITQNECGTPSTEKTIERSLGFIKNDTDDIVRMLADVLEML